jgi:PQQ-dependent catabolism-associated CXXCW motif protein
MNSQSLVVRAAILIVTAGLAGSVCAQDSFSEQTRSRPQSGQSPAQGGVAAPTGPNAPAQRATSAPAANSDPLTQMEREDFGVAPKSELHAGEMHGPTPNSIPGGQVITTAELVSLRNAPQPALLLDTLGGNEQIPGAIFAVPAHQPGSFTDETQRQFGLFLQQATGGNRALPVVLYCLSPECWMSYNAALRAINLGYTNVLWYRGGIESWKLAGQSVQAVQ